MWLANLTGLFVNLMKSIFQLDLGHEDIDLHFFLRKSCTFTKLSLMSAQDSFWIVSGVQRVPRVYSVTQSILRVFFVRFCEQTGFCIEVAQEQQKYNKTAKLGVADFPAVSFQLCHGTNENPITDKVCWAIK